MQKTRLEAFSDGVLAIIVTIMVLEMKAPQGIDWNENIKPLVPKFISYFLSYLFVAIYWVNHHHLLHTVKRVRPNIMWANMNLLFWLSLVPFATAWMGENHFEKYTVAAYAVMALLCGASYNLLEKTICKHYGNDPELLAITRAGKPKAIMSILLYAISFVTALLGLPIVSGILFLCVSIMWLIPNKKMEQVGEKK